MGFKYILKLAFINVFSQKFRATLTIGGIGISIAITLLMMGLGSGFKNIVNDEIKKSDLSNVVTVSAKKIKTLKLNQPNISKIKSAGGVSKVELAVNLSGEAIYHGIKVGLPVYGVTNDYFSVTPSNFVDGSGFGKESGDSTVIVNTAFLNAVSINNLKEAKGKKILLNVSVTNDLADRQTENMKTYSGNQYAIAAVINKGGTPLVYMPYENASQMGITNASVAKVLVDYPEKITPAREAIEQLGFETSNVRDTINQINRIFSVLTLLLVIFGVVTLVVATFGTLNTITISLVEQTKEIGFLRLIGIREGDVHKLFIYESLILALSGTIFGIILSEILGIMGNAIINSLAKSSNVQVSHLIQIPITMVLLILGGTAILGWLVGLWPARRAVKINPLKALRQ